MFARLIESKRVRDRSAGGTMASVLAHSGVIGLLAYSTLGAVPWVPPADPSAHNLVYVQVPQRSHTVTPSRCAACVRLPGPARIDLPPIDLPTEQVIGPPYIGVPSGVAPVAAAPYSAGSLWDSVGWIELPDAAAQELPDNPKPEYPALLRSTHVTGQVSVHFVVDSVGRVETGSIAFEAGSDRLFQVSVRRALLASRFTPAISAGRHVRMLVYREFAFRLTP